MPATYQILTGDCVQVLRGLDPGLRFDLLLTDPPYPEIDRPYGRMTEAQWLSMMRDLLPLCRERLTPRGSMLIVIQPNAVTPGQMRRWAYAFMAWVVEWWNLVQDVYWFNHATMPTVHSRRTVGLLRCATKWLVWIGPVDCYRAQHEILWAPSDRILQVSLEDRSFQRRPSGHHVVQGRTREAFDERGGTTPFNCFFAANTASQGSAGGKGHGAGIPKALCDRLVRYLCPPGGRVLDPFCGTSTVGQSTIESGRDFVGIDLDPQWREQGLLDLGTSGEHQVLPGC